MSRKHMMFHAVSKNAIIPLGTALCGTILCHLKVNLCRIVWFVIQKEHIVENYFYFPGLKCRQIILSKEFIHKKLLNIYHVFY